MSQTKTNVSTHDSESLSEELVAHLALCHGIGFCDGWFWLWGVFPNLFA